MRKMKELMACVVAVSLLGASGAPVAKGRAHGPTGTEERDRSREILRFAQDDNKRGDDNKAGGGSQSKDAGKMPAARAKAYFTEPSVAPDRAEIAFVSGGDIWTAPLAGGEAHLLIAHAANESRPVYSPDGKRLAFGSTRTGNGDIYVYTFATGEVRRLTYDDGNEQLEGWSRDGQWIYFSSTSRDIAGMNDIYRMSAEGGTPMTVSADRYANEFFSAPSPDGSALAFSARGIASSQWWRKGHSHIDESEIWLRREGTPPKYEKISGGEAKELWPMWTPDGKSLYYVSDRSGAQNLWVKPLNGQAKQVTQFREGRVLWPSISYDGRTIVFEHDFEIWKVETGSGQAAMIPLTRRSAPAAPATEHLSLTSQIQELALSPDGKKVAFVVRGEVFAASAKDGGTAMRVTHTAAAESQVEWSPDSKQLVYASERNGVPQLFLYDFEAEAETQLTSSAMDDCTPKFSPDGKEIAFIRNVHEVRVLDLGTKQERVAATGMLERPPFNSDRPLIWSPDGKWIAYFNITGKLFDNVYVVAASGGEAKPVSYLPNTFVNTVSWSPEGTYLLFDTGQRTETRQLARVDLVPRTPKFREDQFRELFQEKPKGGQAEGKAAAAAPEKKPAKPVEIVFDGIRQRLRLLPTGVDVNYQTIAPDGKSVLMIASAAGQTNLYTYSLDELSREPAVARQLTSTAEGKSNAQFTPDGKDVFFLAQGRIQTVNVESRQVKPLAVTAELDVNFDEEKMEMFEQAWHLQRDNFFDPNFNGVNWQAVHDAYAPRIAGARTADEMRRLLGLMVGELNASHSGVSAPFGSTQNTTGKLGLRFDRGEYERAGKLRVTEVIPLSPAALGGIKTGEYLLGVEKKAIEARTNLDELLDHTTGKRIELTIATSADGAGKRDVAVQPISTGAEKQLLYRKWVEERRAYVERVSGGRLGYVHMPDMGAGSLAQLYVDLDTETHAKEGVVIDIRNNNGGFVNVYAIDVLARRPYLQMQPRGVPYTAPARSVLGQRALEKPTILVVNQHSLSDAEDFTEGYRALKLGKVVGEPTAGWIIYTSGATLLDGTNMRMPFIRVTTADGQPMEMHPRPVDVPVVRPIGESYTEKDAQLDAAVGELLRQIGKR
jgi:Tol biopolymer transport system component